MSAPTPQNQFWTELYELSVHKFYTEFYQESTEGPQRALNIVLALASSTSIAGWIIWNKFAFVWAAIIASAHLIHAIRPFMPYDGRNKALGSILSELEQLQIFAERKWYEVSEGELTAKEIHELRLELRSKKTEIMRRHLGGRSLPEKQKIKNRAVAEAEKYFQNYYQVTD